MIDQRKGEWLTTEQLLKHNLTEIGQKTHDLLPLCKTQEDLLTLSTALLMAARKIIDAAGGPKISAMVFYQCADDASKDCD